LINVRRAAFTLIKERERWREAKHKNPRTIVVEGGPSGSPEAVTLGAITIAGLPRLPGAPLLSGGNADV
jgi:hypothetical protein